MKKFYIILGIAGLVLIIWLVFRDKKSASLVSNENKSEQNSSTTLSSTVSNTSSTTSTASVKAPVVPKITIKASPTPISATQKYLDALKLYKSSGYYFQFVSCHGMPGLLTLKKGKKFMLDNRDNISRKIAIVGGQSFKIAPYSFAIATAPSTIGTHYITCDGGGAASIKVQQ